MDHCNKPPPQEFLAHYGILGQKWGVRRYQNSDGTLTSAGQKRYNSEPPKANATKSRSQKIKEARANLEQDRIAYQEAKAAYDKTSVYNKNFKIAQEVYRANERRYLSALSLANQKTGFETASEIMGAIGGTTLAFVALYFGMKRL